MILKAIESAINQLLKQTSILKGRERILRISDYFLNTSYKKGTLTGSINNTEILTVNFEEVDCMTFIEYVEALRLSDDFTSFIKNLRFIRYFDGIVDFTKRRHFFTDWNSLKTVFNVTSGIGGVYTKRKFKELNKTEQEKKLIEGLPIKLREIDYIPISHIYNIISKLNSIFYCGFYTSKKGLDVTHVGILIKRENSLVLRHASNNKGKVVDEPFLEYIKDKEGIIIYKPIF